MTNWPFTATAWVQILAQYVKKIDSCLSKVGGFPWALRFPPPRKTVRLIMALDVDWVIKIKKQNQTKRYGPLIVFNHIEPMIMRHDDDERPCNENLVWK